MNNNNTPRPPSLSVELEDSIVYEFLSRLKDTLPPVSLANLREFSLGCECRLMEEIRHSLWSALPALMGGVVPCANHRFFHADKLYGITYSAIGSDTLVFYFQAVYEGPLARQQGPLACGQFSNLEAALHEELRSTVSLESVFNLTQRLYDEGYRWLLSVQQQAISPTHAQIAERIYGLLRKNSHNPKLIDKVLLCAVPEGRQGKGIYLLDQTRYQTMFERINHLKHFSQNSSIQLSAEMLLHHINYQDLCIKQTLESNQRSLHSLVEAKYQSTRPQLVDAEIAFYHGEKELSIPVLQNPHFYLVASFPADPNVAHEVERVLRKSTHQIDAIIHRHGHTLNHLEQHSTCMEESSKDNHSNYYQGLYHCLEKEMYTLNLIKDETAGEELFQQIFQGFVAKNKGECKGLQISAWQVQTELSDIHHVDTKLETLHNFVNDDPTKKRKRPQHKTINKCCHWLLARKLKPKLLLTLAEEQGWINPSYAKRCRLRCEHFTYATFKTEANYLDHLECYVAILRMIRPYIESASQKRE